MKNAGKARSYGLYRHLRTSKEIIENLLNYYCQIFSICYVIITDCYSIHLVLPLLFFNAFLQLIL